MIVSTEDLVFHSGEERLAATLHVPDGDGPYPGIVLCNGFGGIKDLVLPEIASYFAGNGFAALRFDHRGFGQSTGTKWRLLPMEQVDDIRNAITWLGTHRKVDRTRLGLYGTSFGGANAIVTAALDDRVRAIVTSVSVGNGEAWMRSLRRNWEWIEFRRQVEDAHVQRVTTGESVWVDSDVIMPADPESHRWHTAVIEEFPERRYQLPLETAEAILEYRPDELVALMSPRPMLFIAVEHDLLVPNEQTLALYQRAGDPKKLIMLQGINHHDIYSGEPFQEIMSAATDWFRQYI